MKLDLRGSRELSAYLVATVKSIADYIIDCDATMRKVSRTYGVSLGTVFNYMHTYLPKISKVRYTSVMRIIERHRRFKEGKQRDSYFTKETLVGSKTYVKGTLPELDLVQDILDKSKKQPIAKGTYKCTVTKYKKC